VHTIYGSYGQPVHTRYYKCQAYHDYGGSDQQPDQVLKRFCCATSGQSVLQFITDCKAWQAQKRIANMTANGNNLLSICGRRCSSVA